MENVKSETGKVDRKLRIYSSSQNHFGKVFSFTSDAYIVGDYNCYLTSLREVHLDTPNCQSLIS